MKKSKKLVSALCAMAMLVSALPAASAAEAEPVSEFAGKILPVQVVEETETGMTSRIVEVAIPEGATKAEEDALVYSTVLGGRTYSAARDSQSFVLSTERNLAISQTPSRVGGGNLMPTGCNDYKAVMVDFTLNSYGSGGHEIYFQVRDVQYPDIATAWQSVKGTDSSRNIYIATGSLVTSIAKGISVYAKTEPGDYAEMEVCTVSAIARSK